jgi:hypothetical protein
VLSKKVRLKVLDLPVALQKPLRSLQKNRLTRRVFPSGELITRRKGPGSANQRIRTHDVLRFALLGLSDPCRLVTLRGNDLFMVMPLPSLA